MTSTATIHHVTLTANRGESVFAIRTGPSDLLTQKTAQLRSLLLLTCGASRENFTALHENDQDNVLWLAHELATDIDLLAEVLAGGGVQ